MAVWDLKEIYKKIRNNTWAKASRGAWFGGATPSATNVIQTLTMETLGNASDFGDLTAAKQRCGANSSSTRAVVAITGSGNAIDYKEWASNGNASDFGDLTATFYQMGKMGGTETRAAFAGSSQPDEASLDTIDVVSLQILNSTADFGNLTVARSAGAGGGNNIRGLYFGGYRYPANADSDVVDYITFATAGNATDFGNLSSAQIYNGGCGGKVRGFNLGGNQYPALTSQIDYFTIATTGNASDFGDLNSASNYSAGQCENKIRALIGGLGSGATNIVEYITQATTGNTADFGDLATSIKENNNGATSNNQSGITEDNIIQAPSVTYMPGSGKTLICGGQLSPGSGTVDIDTYNIPTLGNVRNFGDLRSQISNGIGCASSYTRAVFSSGYYFPGAPYYTAEMQAIEFATEGNVCDFGDTTQERYGHAYGNVGNTTRGLFVGGYAPGSPYIVNIIDYITIATMGNATDFGNLTNVKQAPAGASSNTRGLSLGGTTPSNINIIDYVTIASTGDASDFGDLTLSRSSCSGAASSVRAVAAGGGSPSNSDVIDYVTIASTGDASDFGDLTQAGKAACPGSNGTRAVFAGRHTPGKETTIDYITIASTGDAADFGDLKAAASEKGSASDSHGGLQT